jgi:CHAD domain-containing protein
VTYFMYEQVRPNQPMTAYAAQVMEALFRNMAYGVRKVLDKPDEESIHDLRVTALRLRHALRLFGRLFSRKAARKTRKRLGNLQDVLAEVRVCDVALQVLSRDALGEALSARERRAILSELALERRRRLRPLRLRLRKIQRSDALQRWRTRLLSTG